MIRNVTRAYDNRIRPTLHDPHQPRGTPAIQLSPSPELEPLPTVDTVLSMDERHDPDSMDWEPTDPVAVTAAFRFGTQPGQGPTSVWDRFATTKQRIFAREGLTGLERAFESWKDLGPNAISESKPKSPQSSSAVFVPRSSGFVPAILMLASVLRVLSLAVNMSRSSTSTVVALDGIAGFRIFASFLEAFCTIPQVIHLRRWHMRVGSIPLLPLMCRRSCRPSFQSILPLLQTALAFISVIAGLQQTQIVLIGLGHSILAHRVYIIDAPMVLIDLAACCIM